MQHEIDSQRPTFANFGVSIPEDLKDWLDRTRGLIPRSRFIATVLARLREVETEGPGGD